MSVLVVGATGFIGPRLIRRLLARGESVVGMDLNPGAATFGDVPIGAPVIRGDVTSFEDVMRTVLDVKPDRLINLAYGLGAGEGNPHQVMRLDILGMDNCFEAARLAGVKRVVSASSIAVSGQQSHFGDRLANEDDPTYGTSQYAMHKIFNEFQARKYIKNYGMSITGVRPANVTGPDKVRGSVDHVQIMTEAARGKPVQLPKKGLMRLLIHVEDMAEVFARLLLADGPRHALYNSGGIPVSLGELGWVAGARGSQRRARPVHSCRRRTRDVAADRDLALRLARHRHAHEPRILQGPAGRHTPAALHDR